MADNLAEFRTKYVPNIVGALPKQASLVLEPLRKHKDEQQFNCYSPSLKQSRYGTYSKGSCLLWQSVSLQHTEVGAISGHCTVPVAAVPMPGQCPRRVTHRTPATREQNY